MHRRDDDGGERRGHRLSALARDPEIASEQCLRRRRSKTDQRRGLHDREFVLNPRPARLDLALTRLLVDPPFAPRLPLEVLDDVRDIHLSPIDASVFERAIEQLSGRAVERMTAEIFVVARLLADEHHLGALAAFPEDGLRRVLPEIAVTAVSGGGPDGRERL